ncbi:PAS domain S-box protein [Chloroflexota bacterium]
MPLLFWLDCLTYFLATIIAASLTMMVWGANPKHALNRFFALFTMSAGMWTALALMLRLALWLEKGNPNLLAELGALFFTMMGPLLLMFTSRYVGRSTRQTDLAAILGLLALVLISVPLFRHQLVYNYTLDINGTTHSDLSAWTKILAFLPISYLIWSLILFWQERHRTGELYLAFSVLILLAGLIVGGILDIRFPILSFATFLSISTLGYGVVSRQLFNPLREKNITLQREIAERIRVVEALRESEERYRSLFANNHSIMLLIDPETADIVDANPAACSFYGYSKEELINKKITDINTLSNEQVFQEIERVKLEKRQHFLFRHRLASAEIRDVEVYSGPIKVNGRSLLYSIVHDITKRKQAEQALRDEYSFRTSVIERAAEGLCVCHDVAEYPHIEFTVWNDRMIEITGYTVEEINRNGWYQTVYPDPEIQAQAQERMGRMRYGDDLHAEAWEIARADGEKRVINITTSILQTGDGKTHVLALMDDVTEQKQAEEALRQSEERFRTLVDSMDDIVYTLDYEQRHVGVFGRWLEKQGATPDIFLGKTAREILGDEAAPVHEEANQRALAGKNVVYEWSLETSEGVQYYQTSVSPLRDSKDTIVGIVGVGRDITQRKQAEEALLRASRMETAVTLAGGIAHKVNNLMTAALGYSELLKTQLVKQTNVTKILNTISEASRQTSELAQQMLAFARGGQYQPQMMNLNDAIQSVLQFQQRSWPASIYIETNFGPDLWNVEADPTQISQIVLNLLTNAVEAIENDGHITIITENIMVDKSQPSQHPDLKPGPYICLSVQDTGYGMETEILTRVFEPFFTTKFQGRGMGLAAVYGIVNNHGGIITATSQPKQGTLFKVYLPAIQEEIHLPKPKSKKVAAPTRTGQKEQTILIAEHEEMILDMLREMVELWGYQILVAHNGQEAVEITQTFDGEIHLTILDLGIPKSNGAEAYPLLMKARPDMKVILYSGYELDETAQALLDAGASAFIQKPFQLNILKTEIRKALND